MCSHEGAIAAGGGSARSGGGSGPATPGPTPGGRPGGPGRPSLHQTKNETKDATYSPRFVSILNIIAILMRQKKVFCLRGEKVVLIMV